MSLTFRLYISQAYFFKVNYIIDIRASLNKLNEVCPLESEKSPYYTIRSLTPSSEIIRQIIVCRKTILYRLLK